MHTNNRSFDDLYNECMSGSPNSSFDIYFGACTLCASRESDPNSPWLGYSIGLGWFSSPYNMYERTIDLTDKTGDVVNAATYWSSGYNCQAGMSYALERYYTWFGSDDHDKESEVDWIKFSVPALSNQFIVGNFYGSNSWVSPSLIDLTINVEGLRSYAGNSCTLNGDGTETCKAEIYVSGCAEPTIPGHYVYGTQYSPKGGLWNAVDHRAKSRLS